MKLLKHQQFAREKYADMSFAPLLCAVGTGKTFTALALLWDKYVKGDIDAALVVAPNNIDRQWSSQEIPKFIAKIAPEYPEWEGVDTITYNNKKSKKPIPFIEGRLNICCVNIDQFSTVTTYQRYVTWANAHRTAIVIDEATRIANPKAKRTERLLYEFNDVVRRGRSIVRSTPRSPFRAILTGTATERGPFALWSMFEFLSPGYFGINYYAFQNKYGMFHTIDVNGRMIRVPLDEKAWKCVKACATYEQANMLYGVSLNTYTTVCLQSKFESSYKGLDELQRILEKDSLVIRIEDVNDMPEQVRIKKLLPMSPEQARAYHQMEEDMITTYKDKEMSASSKLTMYIRLQQIASGFISTMPLPDRNDYGSDEDYEEAVLTWAEDPPPNEVIWFDDKPKIDQLLADLEELGDEPLLIVTHFSAEADMIYNTLTEKGFKVGLQTGWKKVGDIFKYAGYDNDLQKEYSILVANINCIGMGFNLQKGHHVTYYSNTFSLEDRVQSEGRIFRTGQKNKCVYTDYIMEDTIDMKVFAALQTKKNVSDYLKNKTAEKCLLEWDDACKEVFEDVIF